MWSFPFYSLSQVYTTYVLVYVDDIIVTSNSLNFIQALITRSNSEIALKDLNSLHYFLGIEVHKLKDGSLLLFEQKYIKDLLIKSKMDKAKGITSHMVLGLWLSKHGNILWLIFLSIGPL